MGPKKKEHEILKKFQKILKIQKILKKFQKILKIQKILKKFKKFWKKLKKFMVKQECCICQKRFYWTYL